MPFYLAPYIGTGTLLDPFRPYGSDQPGWSAIDLRPDGGKTLDGGGLNACLLYLPVANNDPQLKLIGLDKLDELGPVTRNLIWSTLGASDSGMTQLGDIIAMLLLNPPVNRWKKLQPSFGWHRIYLGGVLWEQPIMAGGTMLRENWNVPDNAAIDGNLPWTETEGGLLAVVSNQVRLTGNGSQLSCKARCEKDLGSADQYAEMKVTNLTDDGSGSIPGVCVRIPPGGTDFYGHYTWKLGATNEHRLYKFVAPSSETQLGSSDATDYAANEVIGVEADGSSISSYLNGTKNVGPITDTAIQNNRRTGFFIWTGSSGNTVDVDDWVARDLRPSWNGGRGLVRRIEHFSSRNWG